MPGRDGTGPFSQGQRQGGRGLGRGNASAGQDVCVCPSCGATSPHQRAVPCNLVTCPKCGAKMTRP